MIKNSKINNKFTLLFVAFQRELFKLILVFILAKKICIKIGLIRVILI